MKISLISDTHNRHSDFILPGGDLLIHAGDSTSMGTVGEIISFLNWVEKQNYQYKIIIPGNHDFGFEKQHDLYKQECQQRNIILLNHEATEVGGIKIFGSPFTPMFFNWAFMLYEKEIKERWDEIPKDTEILITHGPPKNTLDITKNGDSAGCHWLSQKISDLKFLKLHVFGHIHEAKGVRVENGITFVNASALDGKYRPYGSGVPISFLRDESNTYVLR